MSLSSLQTVNEGRTLQVLHPIDRTPLKGVTITLLGRDSDAFIRAERSNREDNVEHLSEGTKFSAASADHKADAALATCSLAWTGIPRGWMTGQEDDTPLEFSQEHAQALYGQPGVRWLREQVDKFVGTRANFLKAASAG